MSSLFSRKITTSTCSGLDRAGDAREVPNGSDARVQVEELPERHVQAADAAADRRREGALDPDDVVLERPQRVFRQPRAEPAVGLLAGEHLEPDDPAAGAVGLPDPG